MRAAVVYESSFGNTRRVAERIAATLDAALVPVDGPAPDIEKLELLVVGGPTHVHGMSRASTRSAAVEQGAPGEAGSGVREWLERMPRADALKAAAFDTRADKPSLVTGSAAKGIARALKRHGCTLFAPPESFLVTGKQPELVDGELAHAEAWATTLR